MAIAHVSVYGFTSAEEVAKKTQAINERGHRVAVQIDETVQDILKDYNETRNLHCAVRVTIPDVADKETSPGIWELIRDVRYGSEIRISLYHREEENTFRLIVTGDSSEEIKRILNTYLPNDALTSMAVD